MLRGVVCKVGLNIHSNSFIESLNNIIAGSVVYTPHSKEGIVEPQLRRLFARFPTRPPGFDPGLCHGDGVISHKIELFAS
jgi:hypothetical protein